jgi:hypothetical protein
VRTGSVKKTWSTSIGSRLKRTSGTRTSSALSGRNLRFPKSLEGKQVTPEEKAWLDEPISLQDVLDKIKRKN